MKWDKESLKPNGFMCDEMVARMRQQLYELSNAHPELDLIVPETLRGDMYHDFYEQYNRELYRDHFLSQVAVNSKTWTGEDKVCFLVRTASVQDPDRETGDEFPFVNPGIAGLASCKISLNLKILLYYAKIDLLL